MTQIDTILNEIKMGIKIGIKTNYIYMTVFITFSIAFLIISSLLLALTDQANTCVKNKDLTNTGYIFCSFGIVISISMLFCAIIMSDNMKYLFNNIKTMMTYLTPKTR